MSCIVGTRADADPEFGDAVDGLAPAAEIARIYSNVSATAIKDHRRGDCKCEDRPEGVRLAPAEAGGLDFTRAKVDVAVGGAEGEFTDVVTTQKVSPDEYQGAFAKVFELAGLDPAQYRIVGDTVGFSSWQQSSRSPSGDRDLVTLFAYRARFQRISPVDTEVEERLKSLAESVRKRVSRFPRSIDASFDSKPKCHTTLWADWQLGKDARTEEIVEGILHDLDEAVAVWESESDFSEIALCFMGDPIENVSDSYVSQPFVTDLNLTDQLMLALELMTKIISSALSQGVTVRAAFVLCNHGQLTRKGTKSNITDDSDNAQNLLARLLRDYVFAEATREGRLLWHIPEDGEMITLAEFANVPVALAHGHKISGREDAWLLKQTALLTAKHGFTPRLWLTAHRHQFNVLDLGSVHRVQAATRDGGSKYFEDTNGLYSTPGTVALTIGDHDTHGRGFTGADLL